MNIRVDLALYQALKERYARAFVERATAAGYYSWNAFLRDCLAAVVVAPGWDDARSERWRAMKRQAS